MIHIDAGQDYESERLNARREELAAFLGVNVSACAGVQLCPSCLDSDSSWEDITGSDLGMSGVVDPGVPEAEAIELFHDYRRNLGERACRACSGIGLVNLGSLAESFKI